MLPEEFKNRMRNILGDDAERFFDSIENGEAVRSFRINRIKTDPESFELSNTALRGERAEFPPDSYVTNDSHPGSHPAHHSGAVYMQDPSAMSTVYAVKIPEGATVLDSCSAPGGKTTQLAAAVGDSGIVVANEYEKKRCRILQGNVERMGCRNTVVVNLDTAVLAETYPEKFDIVLADAPCSGEGMFRKNPQAIEEWSTENVVMCAERQREILGNVARCVRCGGTLVYSTCTFSLEENEMNVAWFLENHPDFELAAVEDELAHHTSDGIMLDGIDIDMTLTRRFYPHVSRGEGQFIAVMRRRSDRSACSIGDDEGSVRKRATKSRDKQNDSGRQSREDAEKLRVTRDFLEENLLTDTVGELVLLGGYVYLSPRINLPTYGVVSVGVCVGEVVKGRLVPHHQLFSAYGNEFAMRIELTSDMHETAAYLSGKEIAVDGLIHSDCGRTSGWAAVVVDGCATGGAKVSGGVAKNHYPKGLRQDVNVIVG